MRVLEEGKDEWREDEISAGPPKKVEGPCERGELMETQGQETIMRGKHGFWEESVGSFPGSFPWELPEKKGVF